MAAPAAKTFALLTVAVLLAFLVGEITLRALPRSLVGNLGPERLNVEFFDFGPWYTPNQRAANTSQCFSAYPISINQHGMRDRHRSVAKPPGSLRVAVLGDSYMDAVQVADGKYTAALLEQALDRPGRPVEILNFGFSGYGTAQELWLYRRKVRAFGPDLVLLFFLAGNDIQNNSIKLDYAAYGHELEDHGQNDVVPYAYFEADGNTLVEIPNERFNSRWKRFLKEHLLHRSYLVDFLYEKYLYARAYEGTRRLNEGEEMDAATETDHPEPEPNGTQDQHAESDSAPSPAQTDWQHAWLLTELILDTLRREVEADGGKLAVALIPAYGDKKHEQAVALVNRMGITALNLEAPMRAAMEDEDLAPGSIYFQCDGHWNEAGHRIAAEVTAAWLAPVLDRL